MASQIIAPARHWHAQAYACTCQRTTTPMSCDLARLGHHAWSPPGGDEKSHFRKPLAHGMLGGMQEARQWPRAFPLPCAGRAFDPRDQAIVCVCFPNPPTRQRLGHPALFCIPHFSLTVRLPALRAFFTRDRLASTSKGFGEARQSHETRDGNDPAARGPCQKSRQLFAVWLHATPFPQ